MEHAEKKALHYREAMSIIHELNSHFLMMQREDRDYFGGYEESLLENHQIYKHNIENELQKLSLMDLPANITAHSKDIKIHLDGYLKTFQELFELQNSLGVNPHHGDHGLLRSAAHQIEHVLSQHQQAHFLNQLLNLRRTEKDFMLNPSEAKRLYFNQLFQTFDKETSLTQYSENDAKILQIAKREYQTYFNNYADKAIKMGHKNSNGLIGELNIRASDLEKNIGRMMDTIIDLSNNTETSVQQHAKILSIIFPALVLLLGLVTCLTIFSKRAGKEMLQGHS